MPVLSLPNPDHLRHLVANHIVKSASADATPTVQDLTASIAEITLESQTLGSSILQVTLIDPGWTITDQGFLNMDTDGLLDTIEVNFPEGSGMWWRLSMIDMTGDLTQANLTLTFQDRIISYLQDKWGPKTVASGTTTRAQFVKQLVDEVGRGDGLEKIDFVCKALNVIQPIASTSTGTSGGTVTTTKGISSGGGALSSTVTSGANPQGTAIVQSPDKTAQASTKVNKTKGATFGQGLTVGSSPITATQLKYANLIGQVGESLSAPTVAIEAVVFDAIYESTLGEGMSSNGAYGGLLGGSVKIFAPDGSSAQAMATSAFKGGSGFTSAITLAQKFPDDVATLGVNVTHPSTTPGIITVGDSQYTQNDIPISQGVAQAKAIVAAYGGTTSPSSTGLVGAGVTPASDVSQLTRGTTDNPDESSWDCIQRLAAEVNWLCFSNGDTLYYDSGPTIDSQQPALILERAIDTQTWNAINPADGRVVTNVLTGFDGTADNTAFDYQETRKKHGKVQRQSRIRKPQTPTTIRFSLTCGIVDYRAGDVFVLRNAGPFNGRWIVEDATRNCLADTFTQFTLGPPTAPNPEPASTASTSGLPPLTTAAAGGKKGLATGSWGNYASPFSKKYTATIANADMGVDFGTQQGISPGDPILAIGDCYLRDIHPFYQGQPIMSFELIDKSAGYWGWYVSEQINVRTTQIGSLVKQGTVVATFAASGTGIEIGWAGAAGQTSTQVNHPNEVAGRHAGNGTTDGRNFLSFLGHVGALVGTTASPPTPGSAVPQKTVSSVLNGVGSTAQNLPSLFGF